MPITHSKVSAKADGGDASLVQPSDWNASHSVSGGIDLPAESPPPPAAGSVRLFGRSIAGRMLPAIIGPSGLDTGLQPLIARNKCGFAIPQGNANAIQTLGLGITGLGTATAANVATTSLAASMRRLEYAVTTASTTAIAGFRTGTAQFFRGVSVGGTTIGGFFVVCRFGRGRGVAANATLRAFCGLSSTTGAPTDADPQTLLANALGVGAAAADTNYQIIHRNATGTATSVDTGIAKAAADNAEMYELVLFCPPAGTSVQAMFTRLSDGASFSTTISTALPDPATLLGVQAYYSVGGTSSVIGTMLASLYVETDI